MFHLKCAARIFFLPNPSGSTAKRLCIYRGGRRANAKTWCMADAFTKPKPRRTTMNPDRYDPIAAALKEDIGAGDITTDFFVPETLHTSGRIIAREKAIVAGTGGVAKGFRQVDSLLGIHNLLHGGEEVSAGDTFLEVWGLARSFLKGERVSLKF